MPRRLRLGFLRPFLTVRSTHRHRLHRQPDPRRPGVATLRPRPLANRCVRPRYDRSAVCASVMAALCSRCPRPCLRHVSDGPRSTYPASAPTSRPTSAATTPGPAPRPVSCVKCPRPWMPRQPRLGLLRSLLRSAQPPAIGRTDNQRPRRPGVATVRPRPLALCRVHPRYDRPQAPLLPASPVSPKAARGSSRCPPASGVPDPSREAAVSRTRTPACYGVSFFFFFFFVKTRLAKSISSHITKKMSVFFFFLSHKGQKGDLSSPPWPRPNLKCSICIIKPRTNEKGNFLTTCVTPKAKSWVALLIFPFVQLGKNF
jgi:hypothetical protein